MSKHKNLGTVEKLMDGYNPYRQRQEETRGLIKKWEATGLLEGFRVMNRKSTEWLFFLKTRLVS